MTPGGIRPGGVEIKDPTTGFVYNPDYVNHVAHYRAALSSLPPAFDTAKGAKT